MKRIHGNAFVLGERNIGQGAPARTLASLITTFGSFLASTGLAGQVVVAPGGSEKVSFAEDVVRVDITKPGVVGVEASNDKRTLVIEGRKAGDTSVVVRKRNGEAETLEVLVRADRKPSKESAAEAQRELRDIPGVTVARQGDRVLVSGVIASRQNGERLSAILQRYPRVVQDNTDKPYRDAATVVETVNSTLARNGMGNVKLRNFGKILQLQGFAKDARERELALRIARLIEPSVEDGMESDEFSAGPSVAVDVMFLESNKQNDKTIGLRNVEGNDAAPSLAEATWEGRRGSLAGGKVEWSVAPLKTMLQLVQSKGASKVMSNPRVVVRSGNESKFHSGGTVYLVERNKGADTSSLFSIPYGMILNVRPKVDALGQVDTRILAEVSEYGAAVEGMPGLTTSRTETNVTLRDGNSILLTGFKNVKERKSVAKVPVLADIPLVGELFKSRRFQDEARELMVLLTVKKAEVGEDQLRLMESLSKSRVVPGEFSSLSERSGDDVNFSFFD